MAENRVILARKLEMVAGSLDQWKRQIVVAKTAFGTDAYQARPCDALASLELSEGHSVDFEFKSIAMLRAEIDIPMYVSSDASAQLFVNDDLADTFALPGADRETPAVCHIKADVTSWSAGRETCRVRLRVFYNAQGGTSTILVDSGITQLRPMLLQRMDWLYSLQSSLLFTMLWGSILGLAIVLLANVRILGDRFRFYAVLAIVVAWVASVAGMPDIAKLPLRPLLRALYGRLALINRREEGQKKDPRRPGPLGASRRASRLLAIIGLLLFFALFSTRATKIVYCLSVRQYYSTLISRALDESDADQSIKRAFVLLPWRKEAQFLFERRAWRLRNPDDMGLFRQYVRSFASDDNVEQAIRRSQTEGSASCCSDQGAESIFGDPVIWYASVLPEGESEGETDLTERSLSILSAAASTEARIQLLSLELEIVGDEVDQGAHDHSETALLKEKAKVLSDELRERLVTSREVAMRHTYQVACDVLALYYVDQCQTAEALGWFEREIEGRKREQIARGDEILWHRPPEKLWLYYIFRFEGGEKNGKMSGASEILEHCTGFKATFEGSLLNNYPEYKDERAWLRGTILDTRLELYIRDSMLNKGWRY
jgi:hypothetical protein